MDGEILTARQTLKTVTPVWRDPSKIRGGRSLAWVLQDRQDEGQEKQRPGSGPGLPQEWWGEDVSRNPTALRHCNAQSCSGQIPQQEVARLAEGNVMQIQILELAFSRK